MFPGAGGRDLSFTMVIIFGWLRGVRPVYCTKLLLACSWPAVPSSSFYLFFITEKQLTSTMQSYRQRLTRKFPQRCFSGGGGGRDGAGSRPNSTRRQVRPTPSSSTSRNAAALQRSARICCRTIQLLDRHQLQHILLVRFGSSSSKDDDCGEDKDLSGPGNSSSSPGPRRPKEEEKSKQQGKEPQSYEENWRSQLKSLPNIITVGRVASSPLLSYLIIMGHNEMALAGCLVAGLSDVLDGYIARNHNMATVLGTYLDPLADKVLINVLSVSLWYTGTLPTPLVGLWMLKDVTLMTATYRYVARNTGKGMDVTDPLTVPLKVNPTLTSKLNTALQFATLSVGIVHPLYPPLAEGLTALCWVTGGTTLASVFSYVGYSAFTESGNTPKPPKNDSTT